MIKRILLSLVAVTICVAVSAQERDDKKVVWADMDGVTVPLPPKEHPRVFIRAEEIPSLKEKMVRPEGNLRKDLLCWLLNNDSAILRGSYVAVILCCQMTEVFYKAVPDDFS